MEMPAQLPDFLFPQATSQSAIRRMPLVCLHGYLATAGNMKNDPVDHAGTIHIFRENGDTEREKNPVFQSGYL